MNLSLQMKSSPKKYSPRQFKFVGTVLVQNMLVHQSYKVITLAG